jgi:uncharacterized protein (TIGR04255 family)
VEVEMPFPVVNRVIYKKNLLDTVICQVRFPTILKIDTETPAAFQELVRSAYPNLTESSELLFDVRVGPPQGKTEEFQQVSGPRDIKNYEFASEDNKWKINLTRTFFALSTKDYIRWEDFVERFEKALKAFVGVYEPTTFTRVGLRYIDVIVRSKLGLGGVDWSELIQNYVSGVLAVDSIKGEIRSYENTFQVALKGEGLVRVITKTVQSSESGEHCYTIDSDFFNTRRIKHEEVLPILNSFHACALNLFRWCIKDKLHNAMEPELYGEHS